MFRRTFMLMSVVALVAAACSTGTATDAVDDAGVPATEAAGGSGELPSGISAPGEPRQPILQTSVGCQPGEFYWTQADCEPAHSIPLDDILSGGPPPDGIPPIDEPVYESIAAASGWLQETSPVMVVDVNDDVRAYPLAILTWHEIVNDVVGGVPLVVTYCPLCNSALVFERTVEGPQGQELLDFGTSGRLFQSNLVMYDRQHRNLWTQFEGEGVVGERFLGNRLTRLPAWLLGFEQLAELHPDAQVLSRDTGNLRDYGRNPYAGYDAEGRRPFLFRGEIDERFPPMMRLVGLTGQQEATSVTVDLLTEQRSVEVELDGRTIVVLWAPGQASALDTRTIDEGRDVGQTAAFVAEIDGTPVRLMPTDEDGRFVDEDSGSVFDFSGRAHGGTFDGARLDAVPHDDTFWFVWVAFQPTTDVVAS